MKLWRATFVGRQVGAIGIFHPIQMEISGDTEELARQAIYQHYEHLHGLKLVPVTDQFGNRLPKKGE